MSSLEQYNEQVEEMLQASPASSTANKGIPIEDIITLHDKGLDGVQIAKLLGCDRSNVTRRLAQVEGLKRHKKHRGDVLAFKSKMILDAITPESIKAASFSQQCVGYGILYDKERLELDKSTQNHSVKATVAHINQEVETLTKTLEELGVGEGEMEGGDE